VTKVLTLRLEAELLGKAESRALQLGLDRAKHVRSLIEEDVADQDPSAHKFASEDLAEMFEGAGLAADNQAARIRLRAKAGRAAG